MKGIVPYDVDPEDGEEQMIFIFLGVVALVMEQCGVSTIEIDNRSRLRIKEIAYEFDGQKMKITPTFKETN